MIGTKTPAVRGLIPSSLMFKKINSVAEKRVVRKKYLHIIVCFIVSLTSFPHLETKLTSEFTSISNYKIPVSVKSIKKVGISRTCVEIFYKNFI